MSTVTHDCFIFFTRLAPNDEYLPVLYIDQLGVIYRYLKVCEIIYDMSFTVMHLRRGESLFCGWGEMGIKDGYLGKRGGVTLALHTICFMHLNMGRNRYREIMV